MSERNLQSVFLKGITMIELLLWLAVVAVVLMSLGHFFKNDQSAAQVSQAIQRVEKVTEGYLLYLRTVNSANRTAYPDLVQGHYVAAINTQTPWPSSPQQGALTCPTGQTICAGSTPASGQTPPTYFIVILSPPDTLCAQLYNALNQSGYDMTSSPSCPDVTYLKAGINF